MKRLWYETLVLFMVCGGISCTSSSAEGEVEVPLTFHRGYGPFQSAQMGLYIVPGGLPNPSGNAETGPEFTGIPDTWSQVSVVHIETDLFQTVYQNYRSGNISQEAYDRQLERWTWIPDTSYCSSTPIRCFVGVVSGLDPQGVWKVKVDRNGNLDFRDDVAFELPRVSNPTPDWIDSMAQSGVPVRIELVSGGRTLEREVPLWMFLEERYKLVLYSFPYYATGLLDGHRIGVFSTHMPMTPTPFTNPSFRSFCVAEIPDSLPEGGKLSAGDAVPQHDYLIVNDVLYVPQEVDLARGVLRLQRTSLRKEQVQLLQKGFPAPSFRSKELTDGRTIALEDYRGRYLFLEFWSDQCGPCLGAIPAWKKLYERMDTTRMAMLGIIYGKNPDRLVRLVEQKGIRWPQVRDSNLNRLYQVVSFPSSYLLGPDGTILERNLTPEQLEVWMQMQGM